jgi:zinc transport system ATP-binding protein
MFYNKEDKKQVLANMEKLDILALKDRCYRELSGGQQQRVLLARALCATKKMLLLDEPITGLDPIMAQELYSLIHELNRTEHITILMVSHDVKGAIDFASHVLHLGQKQLFFGKMEEYKDSEIGKRFLSGGVFEC